jgi:hypothetical protein
MHVRFPDKLRLRTPKGLPQAIEMAAAHRHSSPSEWARQALLRGLANDGFALLPNGEVEPTAVNQQGALELESRGVAPENAR